MLMHKRLCIRRPRNAAKQIVGYDISCRECSALLLRLHRLRITSDDQAVDAPRWQVLEHPHAMECQPQPDYQPDLIPEHEDLLVTEALGISRKPKHVAKYCETVLGVKLMPRSIRTAIARVTSVAADELGWPYLQDLAERYEQAGWHTKLQLASSDGLADGRIARPTVADVATTGEAVGQPDGAAAEVAEETSEDGMIDPFESDEGGETGDDAGAGQEVIPVATPSPQILTAVSLMPPWTRNWLASEGRPQFIVVDGSFRSDVMKSTILSFSALTASGALMPCVATIALAEKKANYEEGLKLMEEQGISFDGPFIADGTRAFPEELIKKHHSRSSRLYCTYHDAAHEGVGRQQLLSIFRADTRADADARVNVFAEKYPSKYAKRKKHIEDQLNWLFGGVGDRHAASSLAESLNAVLARARTSGAAHILLEWGNFAYQQWQREAAILKMARSVFVPKTQVIIDMRDQASRQYVVQKLAKAAASTTMFRVADTEKKMSWIVDVGREGVRIQCSCQAGDRDDIPCVHEMAVIRKESLELTTIVARFRQVRVQRNALSVDGQWTMPIGIPINLSKHNTGDRVVYAVPTHPGTAPGRKRIRRRHAAHERRGRCGLCGEEGHDASNGTAPGPEVVAADLERGIE
jgi:hypothetical protein